MNRRGHLSSKVPNVKLRPAPAESPASSIRRSTRRHPVGGAVGGALAVWDDDGDDDDDIPMDSASNSPWRGIVVTFTGVDDKPALSALVREMGGEVESALTVKVTHVVARGFGSPKYLYAVEHRIPVMTPEWISESHTAWLRGEELDVPETIDAHRLQPFAGLKIAVSGIDQLDRRRDVIRHIHGAGGVYSKDLDRTCTHLVSAFPTRDPKAKKSDKIKWAVKEIGERDALRRRGRRLDGDDIRIVYEEWIWDCVAFGGRWKEDGYDARKPRAKGRVSYEAVMDGTAFVVPEKEAPVDDDEPVVVKKRKRDNIDNLVGELLSTSSKVPKVDPQEPLPAPAAMKEDAPVEALMGPETEAEPEDLPSRASAFERKPSVLHASRSTAFASSVPATTPAGPSHSPKPQPEPFFAGLRISHAIDGGCDGLENALRQHGAMLVTESERLAGATVDYVVVRLASATRPPMLDAPNAPTLVTDCWIEACCFRQKLIDLDYSLVYRPLAITTPVPGASALVVHISGFSTEQGAYLRRLLRAVGGTLSDKFARRSTTHLLCAQPAGIKYEKALEWGIPAVRESWLWSVGRMGVVPPTDEHLHEVGPAGPGAGAATGTGVGTPKAPAPVLTVKAEPMELGVPAPTSAPGSARRLRLTPTHPNLGAPRSVERGPSHRSSPVPMAGSSPLRGKDPLLMAATVAGAVGGLQMEDDVTAALRRLAQGGGGSHTGGTSSLRGTRRARPSNPRARDGAMTPGGTPGVSTTATTTAAIATTESGTASGAPVPAALVAGPVEDEPIRVTYADAASEKERQRLLAAVMRG